jgi:hypothetical protein
MVNVDSVVGELSYASKAGQQLPVMQAVHSAVAPSSAAGSTLQLFAVVPVLVQLLLVLEVVDVVDDVVAEVPWSASPSSEQPTCPQITTPLTSIEADSQ